MPKSSNKVLGLSSWSLDTWAVLTAFLLAALVRLGLLRSVPW
jgi:hypothetical protein